MSGKERAGVLKLAASLRSAELANLEREIRRVEPTCDRFHLDVADGHYTKALRLGPLPRRLPLIAGQ